MTDVEFVQAQESMRRDMIPMKLADTEVSSVADYIHDDAWVMQQKMDGSRVAVEWLAGELTWHGATTHAAAKQWFEGLEIELKHWLTRNQIHHAVLDGELMVRTGEWWLFDMLVLTSSSGFTYVSELSPYIDRYMQLSQLFISQGMPKGISIVRTAGTTEDKQRMWESITDAGVEGAVVKRTDGLYVQGIRSKDQLKLKLVKTADLVVVDARRTFKANGVVHTGSARLAAWTGSGPDATLLEIANASLIGKDLSIEVGSVVEVAYLYREPGEKGKLVQPRILRKREDKAAAECDFDQFPAYSREAV